MPDTLRMLPAGARIADVGAGGRRITPDTLTVDRSPFPGTRLCSDAHALALRDASLDCVFSTGTFEHIGEPVRALREFHRVLKPGGLIHIETPFIFPFHPDPEDHTRWTLEGLCAFCEREGFERVSAGVHLGPASAVNVVLVAYARSWFSGRRTRRLAEMAASLLLTPHKYLDRFLVRRRSARDLAAGVYFVGRKPRG
ncbi:MAG TPA: class I SAM-dependent methyltransferase [Candidatus Eisenbacteria bacterium]|nr:class I SAM-dependent methyltransferase [Candidatus Eisenbacteria bacterium]